MPDFADTHALVNFSRFMRVVGVVTAAPTDGLVPVSVLGVFYEFPVMDSISVSPGDVVWLEKSGSTPRVSAVIQQDGVALNNDGEVSLPYIPEDSDPSPNPRSNTISGVTKFSPAQTATWRSPNWRDDYQPVDTFDTIQGRYSGSDFGLNTGCAFYGGRPGRLGSVVVDQVSVRLIRTSKGLSPKSAVSPSIWQVSESTRPAGAPTLIGSPVEGPSMKSGDIEKFVLPTSWGQDLVDGNIGGLAVDIGVNQPHLVLAGISSRSSAWTLSISWVREL